MYFILYRISIWYMGLPGMWQALNWFASLGYCVILCRGWGGPLHLLTRPCYYAVLWSGWVRPYSGVYSLGRPLGCCHSSVWVPGMGFPPRVVLWGVHPIYGLRVGVLVVVYWVVSPWVGGVYAYVACTIKLLPVKWSHSSVWDSLMFPLPFLVPGHLGCLFFFYIYVLYHWYYLVNML